MVLLLEACAKVLAERGMKRMFVDGVKGEGLQSLGRCPRGLFWLARVLRC